MKKLFFLSGMLLFTGSVLLAQSKKQASAAQRTISSLDSRQTQYAQTAHRIWDLAELGFMEKESTEILQAELRKAGFQIETGVAGMPTSFIATWGSGKPVIGFLAEYDALPGVSQAAVPVQQANPATHNGHACGHHLFGTGSVAAAIAVKEWLESTKTPGTIRLYGTPAEEGGGGKVFMVRAGLFSDVDAVLTWHPASQNSSSPHSTLAAVGIKFKFYGIASHAAGAPERGRSALDAVEALDFMANLMREHVPEETRIHYVITRGGEAPNVVPAYAQVNYIIRHPDMGTVRDIQERIIRAAEGAAKGTETRMEYEYETGYFNILPNLALSELMHRNLQTVGGVTYTPEERMFAEKIMTTYPAGKLQPESASKVEAFETDEHATPASSDVGDISWVVPTASMSAATWVPGTSAHSWQAVAAGGTSIGEKGMMVAAKTMALSAIELYQHPEIADKAKQELIRRRGADFKYVSLIGDMPPPLNYRIH